MSAALKESLASDGSPGFERFVVRGAGKRLDTRRRVLMVLPITVIALIGAIGPFFLPYSPTSVSGFVSAPPNGHHWFGTDGAGLDVFSRVIAATRENLTIAVLVAVFATTLGILVGLLIGVNESTRGPVGWAVRGLSRVVDLVQAVPVLLTGIVAVSFYGATAVTLTVVMAVVLAPIQIRLVRTEVLQVRSHAYLDGARMAGQSEFELTLRHTLPNSIWAALENSTVILSYGIVLTAALGFIGVGLPPPTPEWGSMLAGGASDVIVGRWWSATFPAIAIAGTVAAVSFAAPALFGRSLGRR